VGKIKVRRERPDEDRDAGDAGERDGVGKVQRSRKEEM
jgi:hypothetical protein